MANIDRRQFIAVTANALAGAIAPRVARAGPGERTFDWNFGFLNAPRGPDTDLRIELGRHFALTHVRGRNGQHAYYVRSRENDGGLLLGFLRKQRGLLKPANSNDIFLVGTTRDKRRLKLSLGRFLPERNCAALPFSGGKPNWKRHKRPMWTGGASFKLVGARDFSCLTLCSPAPPIEPVSTSNSLLYRG
jgi:hypothetical protein